MKKWSLPVAILIIVLFLLLLVTTGSSPYAIKNIDIDPPTRGLLAALQKSSMIEGTESDYLVTIRQKDGKQLQTGKIEIMLEVTNAKGEPVTAFKEHMTKLMHLIVVSKDLSSFQHVHPERLEGNVFRTDLELTVAGPYLLTAEFHPKMGKAAVVSRQWLHVEGEQAANERISSDQNWQKTINGLNISLSASPSLSDMKAGQMVMLLFRLVDSETGNPVKQIEQFLGTSGHCIILSSNAEHYVHAHAMEAMSGGANVMFHTVFPEKGVYKLWGQFQYEGEVVTVPFVVEVG